MEIFLALVGIFIAFKLSGIILMGAVVLIASLFCRN
jgi:hypothetical protein